jgi:hypothetical protein
MVGEGPFRSVIVSSIRVGLLTFFLSLALALWDREDNWLAFGLSAVRGWRTAVGDAHTAVLGLRDAGGPGKTTVEERISLFSVFDGHGGATAARFCGNNLYKILAALGIGITRKR